MGRATLLGARLVVDHCLVRGWPTQTAICMQGGEGKARDGAGEGDCSGTQGEGKAYLVGHLHPRTYPIIKVVCYVVYTSQRPSTRRAIDHRLITRPAIYTGVSCTAAIHLHRVIIQPTTWPQRPDSTNLLTPGRQ